MSVRTAVFVYADDPVTQAGLEQLLRGRPEVHVLATGQIDDAVVAVVATDTIDDAAIRNSPRLPTASEARAILEAVTG